MTASLCIEWVEFQLHAGVTEAQFRAVSDAFQANFLDLQAGYKKRTLVRLDAQGRYADLVHWATAKDMAAAMAASNAFPACGAYFALLNVLKAPSLGTAIAQHENIEDLSAAAPSVAAVGGIEFSLFQPKPGVSDEALCHAAQQMANGLYRGQPGFYGHSVVKSTQGVYADVVFASSGKRAAELCAMWGSGPWAEPCLPYLEMIHPQSIQLAFFETLK